ncbi:YidC/Oxa1 family membrane protein insertase [Actinomadura sp. 21ATH]|uniref:YidC/Oxa1 family membrane protein insertase n=1 Tax=Actinomadura sp. 21ATH TaxID=1735444 RepID=UPI0035C22BE6
MFLLDTPVSAAHDIVGSLAGMLAPLGEPATAAAIVLFTLAVRLVLLPLGIAQARGERSRMELAPRLQALRKKHAKDPRRLQRETADLYAKEGVSPAAGCLPALAQWPFFAVMYQLFVSATVAGHQNLLLAHTLLGAPLGQNLLSVGLFSSGTLVFAGLLVLLALVAWWSSRRVSAEGPLGNVARALPFATVAVAAFVPLAAGLYLLVSGAWTAAERAVLHRRIVAAA